MHADQLARNQNALEKNATFDHTPESDLGGCGIENRGAEIVIVYLN
jgi:hypothetical protein